MANETEQNVDSLKTINTTLLFIGVLFLLLASWILLGNSLIMIAIARFRRLQTLTNRFVFSLALSDFMAGLFIIWQSCFSWFPQLEGSGTACIFRFLNIQSSFCSAFHLIAIATDRYLAVLHPLRYQEFITPRVVNVLIALSWIFAFIILGSVLGTADYVAGVSFCTLPDIVPHALLILIFHVLLVSEIIAMFYMYGRIFWVARKQVRQISENEVSGGQTEKRKTFAKELKAARQLSFIVLVFFVCHATFLVVLAPSYIYKEIMPVPKFIIMYKVSLIIIFGNSALNPIVYALKNKALRKAFKCILCRCLLKEGECDDNSFGETSHTNA